jgi:hypothetical protein
VLVLVRVPHFHSSGGDGGRFVGGSGTDGGINFMLDFINNVAGDAVVVDTVGGWRSQLRG